VIQSVSFDGNEALTTDMLRQSIASLPGQAYFEPQIATDADNLAVLYLNRGYQEVAVQPDPRFTGDRTSVDLHFVIREGPQVLIDHVLIVGNARTKTGTIAREIQLKSGQPLSQQEEDETRTRLTALGTFRRVDISYLQLPGAETHRDVVITVEEAPLTTIGYGGGLEGGKRLGLNPGEVGAVEKFQVAPRGFFQIGRRNLFGGDRSLNLFTRVSFRPASPTVSATNEVISTGGYGFNEYLAQLAYGERRIFGTPADATFSTAVEQAGRSSFQFNRRGAGVTVSRRLRRSLGVSARYSLERTRLFDVSISPADKPLIDRLFPQVRLSIVSGSLIRDTRNDAIDPSAGGLIGLDGNLAARRIGSEVGFMKTFLQGFMYRRLGGGPTVAAFGARLGLATGFPRSITTIDDQGQSVTQVVDDIPANERFFAGGDTTVRGFALDRLGTPATIDANGFPTGGDGLLVLNAELRAPLRGPLGVAGFVDVGNVFLHVNDMDLGALRAAVGFGIRYRSPIGPIRVDVGVKLDRRNLPNGTPERTTAFHVSLGQAF
jgi:outer membrane protein insertion porin family